jgi:pyridoxine/pyridoxamine 5'-phosphate oxidase
MFVQLFTLTDGTFKTTPLSIFADDARAVAVYDATATKDGRTVTLRWVLVDELDAEGKVVSTHCFCYDQQAADAHLAGHS